jgi:hypothetical protein
MCIMCDGASRDEALFSLHASIEEFRWAIQGVEPGPHTPPWAYTIGLSSRFDHPELIVVGVDLEVAAGFMNSMGTRIGDGERFRAGDVIVGSRGQHYHLEAVHPEHFTNGTFAVWEEYYEALGEAIPATHAIEIVWPKKRPRLIGRQGFHD